MLQPAWCHQNFPYGPEWYWDKGCEGMEGPGTGSWCDGLSTPQYLFCCAAGSHLPLSMSHLLELPPAPSVASSPVGPGTFACRLAGEREGARPPSGPWSQTPAWGLKVWGLFCTPTPFSLSCRYLTEEGGVVFFSKEVNVPGGDNAHQLAAHGACCSDGDARETMPYLGLQHIAHSVRGAQYHRVCDEALLKLLWAENGRKG